MQLDHLRLRNVRNHEATEIELASERNLFIGRNGQGKTALLEAIHYLCLTRSFRTSTDGLVLRFDEPFFEIDGTFQMDYGKQSSARLVYQAVGGKSYLLNRQPAESFASVVGRFPVVTMTPDDRDLTMGGPQERRRFVDLVLSQASKAYLDDLMEYRRVLRQRNKMLLDNRGARGDWWRALEPWDEALVQYGSRIVHRRGIFTKAFVPYLTAAHIDLLATTEPVEMVHETLSQGFDSAVGLPGVEAAFRVELKEVGKSELRRGITLVGPHLDEFIFKLNGYDLRKYASQGQHKTFLAAIKVGMSRYLHETTGERPILLLDDVFSELDPGRVETFLALFSRLGQSFITTTHIPQSLLGSADAPSAGTRLFTVDHGTVTHGTLS